VLLPHDAVSGFWFNGRWIVFAFGIAVFYQSHRASGPARWVVPAGIVITVAWWAMNSQGLGAQSLTGEIGVGALAAAALIPMYRYDATIANLAVLRPFAWCGLRCYSLYLLHWPIAKMVFWSGWLVGIRDPYTILVTVVPVTLVISLALAAVFFHFIERPCMSNRSKIAARATALRPAVTPSAVRVSTA
jgi:peptidoglycan/LPS O-acetylase OafA/YrhL